MTEDQEHFFCDIAESTAKATVAQKKSLDSLGKVILDYKTSLDNLLGDQGSVSPMANTTCCTQMDTSEEAETQLHKITEQASC